MLLKNNDKKAELLVHGWSDDVKKMVEVMCCDGCGKEFGKNAELQPYSTELFVRDCKVLVTLTVDSKPAELCMHCLTDLCISMESRPFFH